MSKHQLIQEIEQAQYKKTVPAFQVGDTVRVSRKIVEGNKERIQTITGTVIAKKGTGLSETFSIYRIAYGAAMESVLTLHSPRVTAIEVIRTGKVRRGKLYHLRGRFGKAAKVKEQLGRKKQRVDVVVETPAPEQAHEEPPKETSQE